MDTQTSKTQHIAPTPWWRGLIILFVVCCLLFGMMTLMSDKSNNPQPYKPRPRELTKEERREEKLRLAVENLHLRLDNQPSGGGYEGRGSVESNPNCDNYFYKSIASINGYFGICTSNENVGTPVMQVIEHESEKNRQTSLPPINLNTESTTPLSRERLRIHEELVKNLLL